MKAVQLSRFGGPDTLEIIDTATPTPKANEVLVKVHAAGINFADTQIRQGTYPMLPPLPAVLGMEIAGVIEAKGADAGGAAVGSRVTVPLFAAQAAGGYAEYVVVDANLAIPLPANVSYAEATALMMQGLTALYMLRTHSPKGKSVLVTAAAGAVGSLLVQLARLEGATSVVGAVSSAAKADAVTTLGANACVSYGDADWVEKAKAANGGNGFDLVLESVGGDVARGGLTALGLKGNLVFYGALSLVDFNLGVPELVGLLIGCQSVSGFGLFGLLSPEGLQSGLTELLALVDSGKLKVLVGEQVPLTEAGKAHSLIENRGTVGKVVLVP